MPSRLEIDGVSEIDWTEFLNRPTLSPVHSQSKNNLVSGKTVLITGAGGSIGSSLALLLITGSPRNLILLDRSEGNLGDLYQRYKELSGTGTQVDFILGDICDRTFLEQLFATHPPNIIFHAAALKHLAPLESDPFAALENNVLGTATLFELAARFRAEHFINVSTDKAVSPTSILGVSKRISELLLLTNHPGSNLVVSQSDGPCFTSGAKARIFEGLDGTAKAVPLPRAICEMASVNTLATSVRLGNVIGSSGSVAALFVESLRNRTPITITDRHASRYFITMQEVASFLANSLAIGQSSLLIPEMGQPKKIVDLAYFLAGEFGWENRDLPIVFTGLRDGEKLCEQLTHDFEYLETTPVPAMYKINGRPLDPEAFDESITLLQRIVLERRSTELLKVLLDIVPEFKPSQTLLRTIS